MTVIVALLVIMVIMTNAGNVLAASWAESHPAMLIALNSRNSILVLVTPNIDPLPFFVIATLRLLASDPLLYLMGYWYGDRAMEWLEGRTSALGKGLRQYEQWFQYAAYPLVVIAPNNLICTLAGISGMKIPVFFALNIVGTIGRLALIWYIGDVFSSPVEGALDFVSEYRWWITGVVAVISGFSLLNEFRGGSGEIAAIQQMAAEAENEAGEAGDAAGAADPDPAG